MVLPKRLIVCVALTVFAASSHARAYHGGDGDIKDGGGYGGGHGGGGGGGYGGGGGGGHGGGGGGGHGGGGGGGHGGGGGGGHGGGGGGGHGGGYGGGHASSYQHFSGPVAGDHQEISWKDKHGHHHHDYVAYPKYTFSYGVDDHHTKDHHGHKEHRDGKETHGEFHIHEPGGNIKVVKYHADPHSGFHAEVHNHGGNDHSGGTYGGHKHR